MRPPPDTPEKLLLRALEEDQAPRVQREAWLRIARPEQIVPAGEHFDTILFLCGRGWGKTRTGSEDMAAFGLSNPGTRIALVAPTFADGRDVMVEGDSGIRSVIDRTLIDHWNRSHGTMVLTNGTRFQLFSAEEPERLRGPQHHRAWCDEMAAWKRLDEAWDQLQFGLRLGSHPQVIITTTPKPRPLIRKLRDDPRTIVVRGSTFANSANLAESTLRQLRDKYQGTRLGRQELEAELLEDTPGALWTRMMIESAYVETSPVSFTRVIVAVDPSGTDGETGDQVGIVVAALGMDGRGYILEDGTLRASPDRWAKRVAFLYDKWSADRVVAEKNYGGSMVEAVLRTAAPNLPVKLVSTGSRGKFLRAEPVAALYEQGRVSHVGGFAELEDQMTLMTPTGFVGQGSPDRLDAAVWGLSELMLCGGALGWLDRYREMAEEARAGTLSVGTPPDKAKSPATAARVRMVAPLYSQGLHIHPSTGDDVLYTPDIAGGVDAEDAHVRILEEAGWRRR